MTRIIYDYVVCSEHDETHYDVAFEVPSNVNDTEAWAYHELTRSCSPEDLGDYREVN